VQFAMRLGEAHNPYGPSSATLPDQSVSSASMQITFAGVVVRLNIRKTSALASRRLEVGRIRHAAHLCEARIRRGVRAAGRDRPQR
jgi:hypothetical protein